jgi:hypothetical protein
MSNGIKKIIKRRAENEKSMLAAIWAFHVEWWQGQGFSKELAEKSAKRAQNIYLGIDNE